MEILATSIEIFAQNKLRDLAFCDLLLLLSDTPSADPYDE
jgi:hypothetical protein